jgi:all-trans-retinol dehydrogenase (NAD+)
MTKFNGNNVLITGAASGLGKQLAEKIANRGGRIIAWDINQAGLEALQAELSAKGQSVAIYRVDLSDKEAIKTAADQVLADHQRVDILINNAGIVTGKTLLEASDRSIELTFAVNTMALFWTTRAFMPGMLARNHGHIVTVASAAGLIGTSMLTDYSASKAAAVGFDESLRLELKRTGSRVQTTVVCPFFINTGMFEGVKTRFPRLLPILEPDDVTDRMVRAITKNHKRVVMPPFVLALFPARLLPMRAFDSIASFFGVNKAMDEFTGRSGH